jgi:hypothetical protein
MSTAELVARRRGAYALRRKAAAGRPSVHLVSVGLCCPRGRLVIAAGDVQHEPPAVLVTQCDRPWRGRRPPSSVSVPCASHGRGPWLRPVKTGRETTLLAQRNALPASAPRAFLRSPSPGGTNYARQTYGREGVMTKLIQRHPIRSPLPIASRQAAASSRPCRYQSRPARPPTLCAIRSIQGAPNVSSNARVMMPLSCAWLGTTSALRHSSK